MDTLTALMLALSSGLAGAWLTGRHQRRATDAGGRERLRDILAEHGAALDALIAEIEGLAPVGWRGRLVAEWLKQHMPTLDYYFGRLARFTLGRSTYAVLERFRRATNSLLLAAPETVLHEAQQVYELLATVQERDEAWFEELRRLRSEVARTSREAVAERSFRRRFTDRLAGPPVPAVRAPDGVEL